MELLTAFDVAGLVLALGIVVLIFMADGGP